MEHLPLGVNATVTELRSSLRAHCSGLVESVRVWRTFLFFPHRCCVLGWCGLSVAHGLNRNDGLVRKDDSYELQTHTWQHHLIGKSRRNASNAHRSPPPITASHHPNSNSNNHPDRASALFCHLQTTTGETTPEGFRRISALIQDNNQVFFDRFMASLSCGAKLKLADVEVLSWGFGKNTLANSQQAFHEDGLQA